VTGKGRRRRRLLIDHFDPSHDVLKGTFDTGWIVRQWDARISIDQVRALMRP
jgi:hypothetical protein